MSLWNEWVRITKKKIRACENSWVWSSNKSEAKTHQTSAKERARRESIIIFIYFVFIIRPLRNRFLLRAPAQIQFTIIIALFSVFTWPFRGSVSLCIFCSCLGLFCTHVEKSHTLVSAIVARMCFWRNKQRREIHHQINQFQFVFFSRIDLFYCGNDQTSPATRKKKKQNETKQIEEEWRR